MRQAGAGEKGSIGLTSRCVWGVASGPMNVMDTIVDAIRTRSPISFHYASSDAPGVRVGHPHAVFIKKLKDGSERTYLDLLWTGGISYSQSVNPWRKFSFEKISDVTPDPGSGPFPTAEGYNPDSYEFPIAKV